MRELQVKERAIATESMCTIFFLTFFEIRFWPLNLKKWKKPLYFSTRHQGERVINSTLLMYFNKYWFTTCCNRANACNYLQISVVFVLINFCLNSPSWELCPSFCCGERALFSWSASTWPGITQKHIREIAVPKRHKEITFTLGLREISPIRIQADFLIKQRTNCAQIAP